MIILLFIIDIYYNYINKKEYHINMFMEFVKL